jgi:hypothetical protein
LNKEDSFTTYNKRTPSFFKEGVLGMNRQSLHHLFLISLV